MAEHKDIIKDFEGALDTEIDNRKRSANSDHFLNDEAGQWEPNVWEKTVNRPRFTFDRCNPYIDDIMGDVEQASFGITVKPGGGRATKEVAGLYEGLIRNLENISTARFTYNMAARSMVSTGIAGWEVIHDYVNAWSFDKDLLISPIFNFYNRVWFDPGHITPTAEDSNWAVKLTSLTLDAYKEQFPKGSGLSVAINDYNQVYFNKRPDEVIVGDYYYKKPKKVKLAQMSNLAVHLVDDKFMMILDELNRFGLQVVNVREVYIDEIRIQKFDGGDVLEPEEETLFKHLPVVPVYANFSVSEQKLLYRSAIERLMDPQRGLNYSESRKIEEGALAPRAKMMITAEQAQGHTNTLSTMNTNADPVQLYNHIDGQSPPFQMAGAQINAGLSEIAQSMDMHINRTSGKIQANKDKGLGIQSGVALEKLDEKESSSNYKYTQAMEMAICHTCKILIGAIPKVYSSKRQIQLLGEDNSEEQVTINEVVQDEQTGELIEKNNLNQGVYSVTCTAGPSFRTQQQKTVAVISELAATDPSISQISGDILLNSISAPGMSILAERKRELMIQQGLIPESQLTDEEKQRIQDAQAQNQNNVSAMDQALLLTAQAEAKTAEATTFETQSKAKERDIKAQIEVEKLKLVKQMNDLKILEAQAKLMTEQNKNTLAVAKLPDEILSTQATTLETLRGAMGVETIVGPAVQDAYIHQAGRVNKSILNARVPGNGGRITV